VCSSDLPRTLHLGIDLWLAAGTPITAVLGGTVHSTQDNAAFGDYGPTLILEHVLEGERFFTLYGHLAQPTLQRTRAGQRIETGQLLGWLGAPHENVGWPPHLHFQVMRDLGGRRGDYPGVARPSEAAPWLANCPDPNLLLRIRALA
jgi:murein DD-endopeptidase MepM/ murein hydrolase activator NlpD